MKVTIYTDGAARGNPEDPVVMEKSLYLLIPRDRNTFGSCQGDIRKQPIIEWN